jgi:hypothetical protein
MPGTWLVEDPTKIDKNLVKSYVYTVNVKRPDVVKNT